MQAFFPSFLKNTEKEKRKRENALAGLGKFFFLSHTHSFCKHPQVSIEKALEPKLKQLEFLARPFFESEEVLKSIFFRTEKAKMEDSIPSEKVWMGVYFDREIRSEFHPPVSIRHIDAEVGCGVFAQQRIASCGFVGEYTGVVREREKKPPKDSVYLVRYPVWGSERKKFLLDAELKGNFTRFINHSTTPNLSLQSVYWRGIPRMILIALKEILPGEQLTFDYGDLFWKECPQKPQTLSHVLR